MVVIVVWECGEGVWEIHAIQLEENTTPANKKDSLDARLLW